MKALLFDYGETLVTRRRSWEDDREKGWRAVYRFLKKKGLKIEQGEFKEVTEQLFRGKYRELERREKRDIPDVVKYEELVRLLLPETKDGEKKVAASANEIFWRTVESGLRPKRNAKRTLRTLRSLGVRMAVVSNHHDGGSLRYVLKKYGMIGYFERVVASSEDGERKPAPGIFLRCLGSMKVEPEEAVFVGDTLENDVCGAKRAGLVAVLLRGSPYEREVNGDCEDPPEPDYKIDDLSELVAIVRQMLSENGGGC